jgi:ATP-binding cassette subfamily B protein
MILSGFRLQWQRFAAALAAVLMATVCAFMVPLVVQHVLDNLQLDRLWQMAALILGLTGANGFFSFLAGRWSALGAERWARQQRDTLYSHIQNASMAWHSTVSTGDLMQRCTSDVDTVRKFFSVQLVELGRAVVMMALAVPLMLRLHVPLTLVAVLLIPVAFFYTWRFFLKVQVTFLASDEAEGELSAVLQEHLSGLTVIRSLAQEPMEVERFGRVNDEYRTVTMNLLRALARYWGLSTGIVMVQTGLVLLAGIYLQVSVGTLTAFLMLEQLLLWPVRQMGMILADLGKARLAQGRINEILAVPVEDDDPVLTGAGTLRPAIRGRVEFRGVSFSYGDLPVLQDLSFTAEAGTTVGVLGATGSGKTTMMLLLARLYDPTEGSIHIDGENLATIERRWMRTHLGFVLQEPYLYARTIRENISFAASSAAEAEVIAAARAAAVHDVIRNFEDGYETEVGERGVTLSGGQKQRLAIARALLGKTPILVFDDSLSAVDNRTDARIREALLKRKATTFLITHRTSSLARVDTVLVLENGCLVESGSPGDLLRSRGAFARTWQLQQGDHHENYRHENDRHEA